MAISSSLVGERDSREHAPVLEHLTNMRPLVAIPVMIVTIAVSTVVAYLD